MMHGTRFADHGSKGRFFRDSDNGWLFGVCAGIAGSLKINVNALRFLVVVAAVLFPIPVVLAYALAAWLLRDRPLPFRGWDHEAAFWGGAGRKRGKA